jgi:hypothetical protein
MIGTRARVMREACLRVLDNLETAVEFLLHPRQRGFAGGSLAPAQTGDNGIVFRWPVLVVWGCPGHAFDENDGPQSVFASLPSLLIRLWFYEWPLPVK